MNRPLPNRASLPLLALAGLLPYLISLRNRFALDDLIHIVHAESIRSMSAAWGSFSEPLFPGNLFRPLVTLSYAVTHSFFNLDPLPYHLGNVLLHVLVVLLAYALLRRVTGEASAFGASLLFAVHPLHTEAVANVSGRAELMCAAFCLATLLCLNSKTDRRVLALLGGGAFALMALLSKESAFVLMLLLPLTALFARPEYGQKRSLIPAMVVLAGAGAIYLLLRFNALGTLISPARTIDFLDNPLVNLSAHERALNALVRLGHYLMLCFAPHPLSADYSFAQLTPLGRVIDPLSWVYLLLPIAFAVVFVVGIRTWLPVALYAGWFLCAFAVTSNLVFPIGTIFAERLAYLPSLGAAGVVSEILLRLNSTSLRNWVFAGIVILFAAMTHTRSKDWYDNSTLYQREIHTSARSAKTQLNYGVVLRLSGDLIGADVHMRRALEIYPAFADAAYNLGVNRLVEGDLQGAVGWFDKALKLNPEHGPARAALRQTQSALGVGR